MKKTIYILDAYAFIYRSYYAFQNKPLINSKGFNVSSIFGFFKSLYSLIKTYQPSYFVVALDSKVPTFRHEMYGEYKANRRKTPEDLHAQIPIIIDVLKAIGFATYYFDKFEADDIIASITKKAISQDYAIRIISSDKDLLQLASTDVQMIKQDIHGKWSVYGDEHVKEEWGVPPSLILDLLSITGDAADNVPGVKGIGIKGAQKLLTEYGSLEGIYQNIEFIKGALKQKLIDAKKEAFFSKELIKLDSSLEVENIENFNLTNINFTNAVPMFKDVELPSLVKLYGEATGGASNGIEEKKNAKIKEIEIDLFNQETKHIEKIKTAIDLKKIIQKTKEFAYISIEDILQNSMEEKNLHLNIENVHYMVAFTEEIISILNEWFSSDILFVVYDGKKMYHKIRSFICQLNFPKKIFDVMIASYLIAPDAKDYSLNFLIKTYLDDSFSDGKILKEEEKAIYTLKLFSFFSKELVKDERINLFYNIEMPLLVLLSEMEIKGIKLDTNELRNFSKELGERIKKIEKEAEDEAGHEFNIASYKQLQTVLFEERGLKPDKKNKSGFSTSSEVLEKLKDVDILPSLILEYRSLSKLQSTYTDSLVSLVDEHSRVHTHFIQTGTATGRLSSQNPNLQNIPSHDALGMRIREAFCAEEGNILISSDYSQIELVVLAHISKDKMLNQIIQEGIDVHKRTASIIFFVPEDEVTKEMRAIAKAVNFGVIYGMSAYGLSEELHISRKDAASFISAYFDTYKEVASFIENTYIECEKKGYVETIMARRRYVPEIKSNVRNIKELGKRIAVNTIIQGSAADIMKKAMLDVATALKLAKLKTSILLQVHDELILESPESEVEESAELVKKTMEGAYKLTVPLRTSISKGKNWGQL
ncbi:MAG: DNA polymerase I [Treponema sp.]